MAPLTKKQIIDYIVRQATRGQFVGDGRDSKAPPITLQNFDQEMFRCGAKALRARLSGLSFRQVLQEGMGAFEHIEYAQAQQIASAREERDQANLRQLAKAMAAKHKFSRLIAEVVAELAGPLLDKHPKWSSLRCAVEIEPRLNETLHAEGHRPLGQDAIRKRVKHYRTYAR